MRHPYFFCFLKGVAPSSFGRRHHQHIETYLEDTARSPTVHYHPERRGNQHPMLQILPSHVITTHHGSTDTPAAHDALFCIARQPVLDTLAANDLGFMNIHCPFCDTLHWLDERVSASRAGHPEFGTCCAHGKVMLPLLRVPPATLYNLYTGDTPQAKEFRANIVQYNAALAFTSLGVNVDRSVMGHGPPVFRIHGELRHLSGSVLPEDTAPPSYSQLYIYDRHAAYQYRISRNENLSVNTMLALQHVMWDYNAYASIYQHAYEVLRTYDAPDFTVKLCVVPGHDPRRYNLPTADKWV